MTRSRMLVLAVLVAVFVGAGVWLALSMAPEKHALEQRTDAAGKTYYTCPMHPQVKQDEPGNCPICGMKLIRKSEAAQSPASVQAEGEVLYWYDPMKPEVHFDAPGKSPFMDMQLLAKRAAPGASGGPESVRIDPRMVQNLGIRTAPVRRGTFWQRVDTVGRVDVDERRIFVVEARAPGWVEQLLVGTVGDRVTRGQQLAGVYSPELFAAQQELVLAARSGDAALLGATRQRAQSLGLSKEQIESVVRTRRAQRTVAVLAPADGVVTELNVRAGQQVTPGTPLLRIADLSQLWITIELPEAQGAWIVAGRAAEARFSALPGRTFEGKVDYVYPGLDTQTRSVRARLVLANPQAELKPGMFAQVALFGGPREDRLLVPTEAVIRTGERSVVILAEGDGHFRPAVVTVGDDRQGETEILAGLNEGESIVVSGQFLIDSEANLQSVLGRLAPAQVQVQVPRQPDEAGEPGAQR